MPLSRRSAIELTTPTGPNLMEAVAAGVDAENNKKNAS
jgi:hypothetical protein